MIDTKIRALALALPFLFVAACATPTETVPPPAAAETVLPQTITGPGTLTTKSGATIDIPKGLTASAQAEMVHLHDPDDAVDVYLVEVPGTKDTLAASIEAAWKRVDPNFTAEIEQTITPPDADTWDALMVQQYVKSPKGVFAQAVARQKGPLVYVALLRGPMGNLEKRGAQIRSFIGSLKVAGVKEENLEDRAYTPLAPSLPELEAFIDEAMVATETPGLQIAIVEGDRIVYAKGFGVRKKGRPETVDADTLMMIGSVSKSMTTLMMASLVDDEKLDWEQKVTEAYPTFRLGDPALAQKLVVEQLVCACTGLPRKDLPLILEFEKKKPRDVFAELGTMKPTTGLGETYQYQNHLVAAGGYIAAHLALPKKPMNEAYADVMQSRVFDPMGMKRTTLDLDRAVADPNHATPHSQDLDGIHHVVALDHERFANYVGPSGGIWSTANEMASYIITEIQRGVAPSGTRVASEENLTRRWKPQVAIADGVHYGLGYVVVKKRGLMTVTHGGGTMGFATKLTFMPDKKVGFVMISNGTGGHLVEQVVGTKLGELWFGIDNKSAATLIHTVEQQTKAFAEMKTELSAPETKWMKPFLGRHHNAEIGAVTITKKGDAYWLDAGVYKTQLMKHVGADKKVTLTFIDPPLAGIGLVPLDDEKGTVEMIRGQERYTFTR